MTVMGGALTVGKQDLANLGPWFWLMQVSTHTLKQKQYVFLVYWIIVTITALFVDGNHVITNDFQWAIMYKIHLQKR